MGRGLLQGRVTGDHGRQADIRAHAKDLVNPGFAEVAIDQNDALARLRDGDRQVRRQVTPKGLFGQALEYCRNQMIASYCLLCHARRFATILIFFAVTPAKFYYFGRRFGRVSPVGPSLAPSRDRSRRRRSRRNSSASAQMIHCR